jgi:hypothetical protein
MLSIHLDDPAWHTTFPRRVAPQEDEWLPGLLLRCDEANHWASRTTLAQVLRPGPEKFHRCWRTETPNLSVLTPHSFNLEYLARLLALPQALLLATTYQVELARLYEHVSLHPKHLSAAAAFHLCPACLAERRLLRRLLVLPHLTTCPDHRLFLLSTCQCGRPLRLFHRQAPPFTCPACGLDWAELPQIEAEPERLEVEHRVLSWYAFFFAHGSFPLLLRGSQLAARVEESLRKPRWSKRVPKEPDVDWTECLFWEPPPLGDLVEVLMKGGVAFHELLA